MASPTTMRNPLPIILLLLTALLSGCSMFKTEEVPEDATVEEIYAMAKEGMANGNWGLAVERLRQLEAKFPYGVYAEQAQLDTVYAYYRNSEPGLAIAAADRFIKLHPTHESVDYAYFLKGQASYEEDKSNWGVFLGKDDLSDRDPTLTLNALNTFEEVYTRFPDSQYAPIARDRIRYLTNSLAKHEVAVARYYQSKDAHVAAVNRAKGSVEDYPEAAAVEDALGLMLTSYIAMGLFDLADDSRRVLELNFPDSKYLVKADQLSRGASESDQDEGFLSSLRNLFRRQPAG